MKEEDIKEKIKFNEQVICITSNLEFTLRLY